VDPLVVEADGHNVLVPARLLHLLRVVLAHHFLRVAGHGGTHSGTVESVSGGRDYSLVRIVGVRAWVAQERDRVWHLHGVDNYVWSLVLVASVV